MNNFSRLRTDADPMLNVHQLRASFARRLIVGCMIGIAFAFTAGNVVLGLFLPALLWLVEVVFYVLLGVGLLSLVFMGYCYYRSYKDYRPEFPLDPLFRRQQAGAAVRPAAREDSSVIEGQYRVLPEPDTRND